MLASPMIPILFVMSPDMPRLRLYDHAQSWVVHPISELITYASRGGTSIVDHYVMLVGASKERDDLKREVDSLESQLLDYQESQTENARLRALLKLPQERKLKHVAGRIIAEDPSGESLGFLLNVGTNHGIKERMPVISSRGVVGTIRRTFPEYSLMVAMQDPSHIVDGMIVRSRSQFVVQGKGGSLTGNLKYLDRAADVRVGDLVITSGLDKIFPKGIPVGFIVEINRPKAGVTQNATLRPSVDLSYLEEVLVVLSHDDSDYSPNPGAGQISEAQPSKQEGTL